MSDLVKNTSHIQDAKERLKFQFKDKDNINKLLEIHVDKVQELENVFWDLLKKRFLDDAEGEQLDKLGTILGSDRNGLEDQDYRFRLKFKVGQNTSEGTTENIIDLFKILTQSAQVLVDEYFPASVVVSNGQPIPDDVKNLVETLLQKVVGAGIKFYYIATFPEDEAFAYLGKPNEGAFGYGDITDPTVGGKYAGII